MSLLIFFLNFDEDLSLNEIIIITMVFFLVIAIQSARDVDQSVWSRATTPGASSSKATSPERIFYATEPAPFILHSPDPKRCTTISEESLPTVTYQENETSFPNEDIQKRRRLQLLTRLYRFPTRKYSRPNYIFFWYQRNFFKN